MTMCDVTPHQLPAPVLHRLRPRPPAAPPALLRRAEVPASVWTGLHLDGALVPLWRDTSRSAGVPEDPTLRALAFAPLVPARAAVGRTAAAWVHAGGTAPRRVTVLVRSGARRPDPHPDRASAEADLVDEDLQLLGGVLVTTPARTALDVARWEPTSTALHVLRALQRSGLDLDDTRRRLDAHPAGRGLRAARTILQQL